MNAVPPEPPTPERPRADIPTDEADNTEESARPAAELDTPAEGARLEVSGTQLAASVLASVSAAVVASYFSLAGTIVGAAVMSIVATVGSAAYGLGIHRTKHRLHQLQALRLAQATPLRRPGDLARHTRGATGGTTSDTTGRTEPGETGGTTAGTTAGTATDATASPADATRVLDADLTTRRPSSDSGGWRGWLSERRWGVAAGVALVFVISLMSVTLIELAGDRALSGESSGSARTSLGALLAGDDGREPGGDDDNGDAGDADTIADAPDRPSTTVPSATTSTSTPDDDRTASTTTTTAADDGEQAPPTSSTSTTSTTSTSAPPATTTTTTARAPMPAPVPTTAPVSPTGSPSARLTPPG